MPDSRRGQNTPIGPLGPIAEGADPFVVRDGASYLWCFSEGDRAVTVARSDRITDVGERRTVWRAPDAGPCSAEVWAPELHLLDGRWHIYVAASDGDNRHHRAFVLVADSVDPQGTYTAHGPLHTGDATGPARWAIDMTVLAHKGRRFALWSGWPGEDEIAQHLYVAPMASPTEIGGPRVLIADSGDHPWERVPATLARPRSIDEAPQVLQREGRTFVLFSASSALTASYAMGLLELVGEEPVDPTAWRKHPQPLCPASTLPGAGHGVVVDDSDGRSWLVHHAKIEDDLSFRRAVHVRPIEWSDDGLPRLDATGPIRAPEPPVTPRVPGPGRWGPTALLTSATYLGHHQLIRTASDRLELGRIPAHPVNAYRSGEKLVLRDVEVADVEVTADLVDVTRRTRVGVLLRVEGAALGHHAQRGYLLEYDARTHALAISRHDGAGAVDLAHRLLPGRRLRSVQLVACARGRELSVRLDGTEETVITARDDTYTAGSVGVRLDGGSVGVRSVTLSYPDADSNPGPRSP